jgi:hypothetical protein
MAKVKVPYLLWRDGRPRWVPSPRLRGMGHKGQDLKAADGTWLDYPAAVQRAMTINANLDQMLPAQAATTPEARTAAAMFDLLRKSGKFQSAAGDNRRDTGRLAPRTLRDYLYHLTILEQWCGDIPAAAITRADTEDFYLQLVTRRGKTVANAIMRTARIAWNYGDKIGWITRNPFAKLEMLDPGGRLVLYTPDEIAALIAAADYLGLAGMGDAIALGVLTGQREGDLLILPEGDLSAGYYVIRQKKRGARAFVPLTAPLVARLEASRRRKTQDWPGVHHTLEVINTRTGKPYHRGAKEFRRDFAKVRFVAAGGLYIIDALNGDTSGKRNYPFTPQPGVLGKWFSDLRDTAVTWLFMAGATEAEIANITGHSLVTVRTILDKHYFVRNEDLARTGGAKLDAYLANSTIRWA